MKGNSFYNLTQIFKPHFLKKINRPSGNVAFLFRSYKFRFPPRYAAWVIHYSLAVLLLFAGISKLFAPEPTLRLLSLIGLSTWQIKAVILILPFAEICVGLMLLFFRHSKVGPLLALGLFFTFFVFSVYMAVMGIRSDCGCFGNAIKMPTGGWLIIRNGFFLMIILWLMAMKGASHEKGVLQ